MTITESDHRLGELILFICQKSANDSHFGSVKLNKLLYYSDFFAYGRWGQTITGAEYWNLPEGPAPKRLVRVRKELLDGGALAIQEIQFPNGLVQKRPIQLRPPDLSLFRGDQLFLAEEVIDEHIGFNAQQISEKSHQEWGWKLTKEKETIAWSTVLLSPEPLSESEIEKALAKIAIPA